MNKKEFLITSNYLRRKIYHHTVFYLIKIFTRKIFLSKKRGSICILLE